MSLRFTFGVGLLCGAALVTAVMGALLDSGGSRAGEAAVNAQVGNDVVEVVLRFANGSERVYTLADAPPSPTPPAPPTNTPRPSLTPTATVTPSRTPSPTAMHTEAPGASETPLPSPTPEVSKTPLPSGTPPTPVIPTVPPTVTPQPALCTGLASAGWYIRSGPDVVYPRIGYFSDADNPDSTPPAIGVQTFRLLARRMVQGAYWYAFWLDSGVIGWSHSGAWTLAGDCENLPADPPVQEVRIGPHLLFNASVDRLAGYLRTAGVVKEVSGDGHLLAAARALNPQTVTVYRYVDHILGNCAPDWMDGRQWVDALYARWPKGADWYEVENECAQHARAYSNTHVIETMARANELGVCLLLYSFGVGTPEPSFMPQITPALDYALAHECQPGRHHALALHAYGLNQPREDVWLFSRWRMLCDAIPGYCARLGLWFTEWGWYREESDPVVCALEVANVAWARVEYKDAPIRGVMLWSFGESPVWRDLTPCASDIANVLP